MKDADRHIEECIVGKRSFVLDGGAGAGKTHSLVCALRYTCEVLGPELAKAGQRIACITYTNAAKDEVVDRTGRNSLIRVSTIHDFLWSVAQGHQRALKRALIKFNDALDEGSARKTDPGALAKALPTASVTYSDTGSHFLEGRLFHDDLIEVAAVMFADNPLLSRIVGAQFPYIFVDEYQDASAKVIDILLRALITHNPGKIVVGLFGDKLQNIYDSGVGELPAYATAVLERVVKGDNRRCSIAVIDVLNRLRSDITQFPAYKNVPGDAVFIHVSAPDAGVMERIRDFTRTQLGWLANDGTERELYLTHKLIARKGGYQGLLAAFEKRGSFYRDRMLRGEDPCIAFFLDRLEPLATAWAEKRTGLTLSLLREGGFELTDNQGKKTTASALDKLNDLRRTGDVRTVLTHLRDTKLAVPIEDLCDRLAGKAPKVANDPEAAEREEKDVAFFTSLLGLPYGEIAAYASFFQEHTPFITKHGVKGVEFDTVYVILDDKGARWTTYSFDKFLSREDETGNANRFRRTRNLFYVCCSRAKKNLAVIDLGATSAGKTSGAQAMFGATKCFQI